MSYCPIWGGGVPSSECSEFLEFLGGGVQTFFSGVNSSATSGGGSQKFFSGVSSGTTSGGGGGPDLTLPGVSPPPPPPKKI